ncbi:hypothetical protein E4O86_20910, partial [Rhizobiales bacterium L72]|nr:hypothetical protein [Propylenella binzhouense]
AWSRCPPRRPPRRPTCRRCSGWSRSCRRTRRHRPAASSPGRPGRIEAAPARRPARRWRAGRLLRCRPEAWCSSINLPLCYLHSRAKPEFRSCRDGNLGASRPL